MVSHTIGIIGVIFQMKPFGGARIVNVAGLLLSGPRKGDWWIPLDQYTLKHHANKSSNIP